MMANLKRTINVDAEKEMDWKTTLGRVCVCACGTGCSWTIEVIKHTHTHLCVTSFAFSWPFLSSAVVVPPFSGAKFALGGESAGFEFGPTLCATGSPRLLSAPSTTG